MMASPLSRELRERNEFYPRRLTVRKGDVVLVRRGGMAGHEGKVIDVDLNSMKVQVDGVVYQKADNTSIPKPIDPSNIEIIKLDLSDKRRKKKFERILEQSGLSEEEIAAAEEELDATESIEIAALETEDADEDSEDESLEDESLEDESAGEKSLEDEPDDGSADEIDDEATDEPDEESADESEDQPSDEPDEDSVVADVPADEPMADDEPDDEPALADEPNEAGEEAAEESVTEEPAEPAEPVAEPASEPIEEPAQEPAAGDEEPTELEETGDQPENKEGSN